jgi:ZF-HD class homeobox domain-containing protein
MQLNSGNNGTAAAVDHGIRALEIAAVNKTLQGSSGNNKQLDKGDKFPKVPRYRECQKNHAASLGSHALDGCGEFLSSAPEEEGSVDALKCAACGCHRNFHRREVEAEILCDCHKSSKDSKMIKTLRAASFAQAPAAHHGLAAAMAASYPSSLTQFHGKPINPLAMAMSTGAAAADSDEREAAGAGAGADGIGGGGGGGISSSPASTSMQKKRFRTKFSTEQKDEMCNFAEKLGWKMQKHDEAAVQEFCATFGVKRHVLKVWMHNNKHTMAKKT